MVKILFLVKKGQKGRHGWVKSEHVLWIQEYFWSEKSFESKKKLGLKIVLGPIWVQQNFGSKIILGQEKFWTKKFSVQKISDLTCLNDPISA